MMSPSKGSFGSAARTPEDAANKPGQRKLVRVARREAPRLPRGRRDISTMVAPFGAPSPRIVRGETERRRPTRGRKEYGRRSVG
jgi:hypothetical protein